MDNYFDFDMAAVPPYDLNDELSSVYANACEVDGNECFDSLFLDKSASLPIQQTVEPGCVILKLINDREVEAVKWQDDPTGKYPMFKAKYACTTCAQKGMDCYLASRGALIAGCTACLSLYKECSFTHAEMPKGYISTFPGIAEDDEQCQGRMKEMRTAMKSFTSSDIRGRKSGSRFHRDAVKVLKQWLSEHTDHPYPNERERDELKELTGLKRSQINNWLANARRRGKVRPSSDPASPILGAVDIPTQNNLNQSYENLGPLDRWKCSPPENEPARMTDIAQAITSNYLPHDSISGSLQNSRTSSRKASSEEDSSNLSIMFQPPSESSFETRNSTNSSFSFASSQSYRSRQSFASSQDRRRRRRAPLLHQRQNSLVKPSPVNTKKGKNAGGAGGKERIFQCTFCTETFLSKYDWQRHEKSLHLALERWTCCPSGSTRIDPITGIQQCIFCDELTPTVSHLEHHNYQACQEKTVPERTFYRKDHLRQHLRLMHGGVKYQPYMESWKSTTFEIKSRCGFCPSLFTTWQSRADHLAAHFKNGATMNGWSGGWGFEAYVEKLVENALPPYLIGLERVSMNPYRARAMPKSTTPTEKSPISETPTGSSGVDTGTEETSDWSHMEKIEVDQITKDSNCWNRLEDELIKFVMDQKSVGASIDDKMLQDHARLVIYGDPDPWDWTMADNAIWLEAFKLEHDIVTAESLPQCEYTSTRSVPVAAPYVIKGGLKNNGKRTNPHSGPCPTDLSVGHRNSVSNLPGIQERPCPLADARSYSNLTSRLSYPGSSYTSATPITPADEDFNFNGPHGIPAPLDGQAMDLDFDAIDFHQLELNAFGEMEFEESLSSSVPVTSHNAVPYIPASFQPSGPISFGTTASGAYNQGQKGLTAPVNPFTSIEDMPEMSLEAFDQLTGYVGSFRQM